MRRELMNRRSVLIGGSALAGGMALPGGLRAAPRRKPNIVIVMADDLGYGDLRSFGGHLIATPNIDQLSASGFRLTNFFASANICTPSRAGFLTGRYPIRTGLAYEVIQAKDTVGLPLAEVTIPEVLGPDYARALIGKWHLGHVSPFWPPTVQGFDTFFGLPYSHDMKPLRLYDKPAPGVELTSEDVDFSKLSERFFDRGLRFIDDNSTKPFLLILALTAPHVPLVPNEPHSGHSQAGAYGDVVEEVDAGVGRLMARLRHLGIERDTLVVITSDNGPWFEGSAGALRDRKGGAGWEGGYRVPFIAHMPGTVARRRVSNAIAMNIDFLPTIAALTGSQLSSGVEIDGKNLLPLLQGTAASAHDELILFNNERVAAVRTQKWKLVVRSYYRSYDLPIAKYGYPLLFDLEVDPGENYNVALKHPDVMQEMMARVAKAQAVYEPLGLRQAPDRLPGAD